MERRTHPKQHQPHHSIVAVCIPIVQRCLSVCYSVASRRQQHARPRLEEEEGTLSSWKRAAIVSRSFPAPREGVPEGTGDQTTMATREQDRLGQVGSVRLHGDTDSGARGARGLSFACDLGRKSQGISRTTLAVARIEVFLMESARGSRHPNKKPCHELFQQRLHTSQDDEVT